MTISLRFVLRLIISTLIVLTTSRAIYAQESMMRRTYPSPAGGNAINRGDFNNDGILDLVTVDSGTNTVSVYLGQADGTFTPAINSTGAGGTDFAVGDFNNDGKLDLAVVNGGGTGSAAVQVLLGKGDGAFLAPITIPTRDFVLSITTSDFNNDGKMDLAVAEVNGVEVFEGAGTGLFTSQNFIPISPASNVFTTKVRVGDFNRDGKPDIALLDNNAITALFGNGDFTFEPVLLNTYTQANGMNTGDINQDGFTDILVSFVSDSVNNEIFGGVDGYFGGDGQNLTLDHLIAPGAFQSPTQMIAADVNGDGINDIAALSGDSSSAPALFIWLGNANGAFQQTPTIFQLIPDSGHSGLVAGDFNRDGKIDFAASVVGRNVFPVLLNATPRATCQKSTANPAMTVCQPQEATFSNSPLHIIAQGNDSKGVSDIDVFIDNVKKGSFPSSSINQFFDLANGNHFVVVKGFDPTGASFRSDRHVTIFSGAPGETCPSSSSTALSVNICLPAQNAALSSPVQILANSYSPSPFLVTAIQVYIDNQLAFNDQTATYVNHSFSMSAGMHFIVVKAFNAAGNNVSESRTIDVK